MISFPAEADKVWLADGATGAFTTYHLTPEGQWTHTATGQPVAATIPTGSAILIERVGPDALFSLGD